MFRWIFLLAASTLALAGCVTDSDSPNIQSGIQPGTYQGGVEFTGNNYGNNLKVEETFNKDGSYAGKAYFSDGTTSCLLAEGTAIWTGTVSQYILNNLKVKNREDCKSDFGPMESLPNDTTMIRNVTENGFQELYTPDNQPSLWVTFKKI